GSLRMSLIRMAQFAGEVESLAQAVAAALSQAGETSLHEAANRYIASQQEFAAAAKRFHEVAGLSAIDAQAEAILADIMSRMAEIQEARHLLRDWSSWCSVRERGQAHGLGAL